MESYQVEMLQQFFDGLSEASLNDLRMVLMKRVRRQALQVKAGNDPDDLRRLQALQGIVTKAHERKLQAS